MADSQFFHKRYVNRKRFSQPPADAIQTRVKQATFDNSTVPMTINIMATSHGKTAAGNHTSTGFEIVKEDAQPKHLLDLASKYLTAYQLQRKKNTTQPIPKLNQQEGRGPKIIQIEKPGEQRFTTLNPSPGAGKVSVLEESRMANRKDIMTPPMRFPPDFKQTIEPLGMFNPDGRQTYNSSEDSLSADQPLNSSSARRVIYSKTNRPQPLKNPGQTQPNVKYDRDKYRKYYFGQIKQPGSSLVCGSTPDEEYNKVAGQYATFADYIKHTNHVQMSNPMSPSSVFKPNFLSPSPHIVRQRTEVVDGHNVPTYLYTQRERVPRTLMGSMNYRKNPFPPRNMREQAFSAPDKDGHQCTFQSFPIQMQDQQHEETSMEPKTLPETLQSSHQSIEAVNSPVDVDSLAVRMDSIHSNQLASEDDAVAVTLQPRHLAENSDSQDSGRRRSSHVKPIKNLDMRNFVNIKKVPTTTNSRLNGQSPDDDYKRRTATPISRMTMQRQFNTHYPGLMSDDEMNDEQTPVEYVAIKAQNGAHWLDLDMIKEKKKSITRGQKRTLGEIDPRNNGLAVHPQTSSHQFRKPSWNLEQFLLHQQNQSKYWRHYINKVEQQKRQPHQVPSSSRNASPAPITMQTNS